MKKQKKTKAYERTSYLNKDRIIKIGKGILLIIPTLSLISFLIFNYISNKNSRLEKKKDALSKCDVYIEDVNHLILSTRQHLTQQALKDTSSKLKTIDFESPPGPGIILTKEESYNFIRKTRILEYEISSFFSDRIKRLIPYISDFSGIGWHDLYVLGFNQGNMSKEVQVMKKKEEVKAFEEILHDLYLSVSNEVEQELTDVELPKLRDIEQIDLRNLKHGRDIGILVPLKYLLENSEKNNIKLIAVHIPIIQPEVELEKTGTYTYKLSNENKMKLMNHPTIFLALQKDKIYDNNFFGGIAPYGVLKDSDTFIGWTFTAPNCQVVYFDNFWANEW